MRVYEKFHFYVIDFELYLGCPFRSNHFFYDNFFCKYYQELKLAGGLEWPEADSQKIKKTNFQASACLFWAIRGLKSTYLFSYRALRSKRTAFDAELNFASNNRKYFPPTTQRVFFDFFL